MLAAIHSASTYVRPTEVTDSDGRYGKCRCCLAVGLHPRHFEKADLETLLENFNLFLLVDACMPHLICSACISSLEHVKSFRLTVMKSESILLQTLTKDLPMKIENTNLVSDANKFTPQVDPLEVPIEVKSENDSDEEDHCVDDIKEDSDPVDDIKVIKFKAKIDIENDLDELVSKEEMKILHPTDQESYKKDSNTNKNSQRKKLQQEKKQLVVLLPGKYMRTAPSPLKIKTTAKIVKNNSNTNGKKLTLLPLQKCKEIEPQIGKRLSVEPHKGAATLSTHIIIGDKSELATKNTKVRSNIIQIIQNTTVVPFRSTQSYKFKCFYCDFNTAKFSGVKTHTDTEHAARADDHTILKWLQSRNHKMIYAEISSIKCRICGGQLENVQNTVNHLTDVHKKVFYDVQTDDIKLSHGVVGFRIDNDKFDCHLCDKEFRFFHALSAHVSQHYASFDCVECGKKYLTPSRLQTHQKHRHELHETKCTHCDKVFDSMYNMRSHRYSMHLRKNNKTIKCPLCPQTFLVSRSTSRYIHMEKDHGIKRPIYDCKICKKNFNSVHTLTSHRQTYHIRKNPYMCDICGYVTMERTVMGRHLDYHNGVRNFECDICHKKLRTKSTLRLHLRGHYNDKRFACSFCDAAFIQKHCLQSHMKSRHPDLGIVY